MIYSTKKFFNAQKSISLRFFKILLYINKIVKNFPVSEITPMMTSFRELASDSSICISTSSDHLQTGQVRDGSVERSTTGIRY